MTSSESRPRELFIHFSGSVVAVEVDAEAVWEAACTMFRLMLAEDVGVAAAVVERFGVTHSGGRYAIERSARFADRHAFPHEALNLAGVLRLLKCHVLQTFIDRHPERLWLHAGAAASDGRAVLVAGAWGSGKSTLVAHLCASGWAYLSDDVVPLLGDDAVVSDAVAEAFPLGLAVREASPALLDRDEVSRLPKRPIALAPTAVAAFPAPVAAVVFPRYDPDASEVRADRLAPGEATLALLRCMFNLADHGGAAVQHLGALVDRVPMYLVRYADPEPAAALVDGLLDGSTETEGTVSLADVGDAMQVDPWLRVMHHDADPAAPSRRRPPEPEATEANTPRVVWEPWAWDPDGRRLTVGMAVYDDYDGAYFTLQALRLYHPEVADEVEFVIVDNNPDGPCGEALRRLAGPHARCRYVPNRTWRGPASKDLVFREARTPYVLCVDSHVLVAPGVLRRLLDYFEAHPDTPDLLQGPLLYEDGSVSTHFEPVWQGGMYGTWGMDERGEDPDGVPFDVPMQGMGLFASQRAAWPGFNPRFAGFGGEEGYIHEKVRQRGGRTLCLPFLRWMHRFERPLGVRYPLDWEDRIHNYVLGFRELGLDTAPIARHFRDVLGEGPAHRAFSLAQAGADHPFSFFDAIYGVSVSGATDNWQPLLDQLAPAGLGRRLRAMPSTSPSASAEARRAMSVQRIIAEAKRHDLRHVLVLEDDVVLRERAVEALQRSLDELEKRDWALLCLGGTRGEKMASDVPGRQHLKQSSDGGVQAYAVAYHHSVYDQVLADLPADESGAERWCERYASMDRYLSEIERCYVAEAVERMEALERQVEVA